MSVSEEKLYSQFVDRALGEVTLGLRLDNAQVGSRKRKVHDALVRRSQTTDGTRTAGQKVIEGRFMLGGDDASYLASGLACLWSTVGEHAGGGGADDAGALTLAPASLYAPDAVNGIRQGLLRALERRNAETQKEAPKQLPMLMRLLATIVDFVPDVPTATARLLDTGAVRTPKERELLLAFLRDLKEIMADASDAMGDPETSLARRILNGSRAGSRASMQRMRRLEEAERANDRLVQQYNQSLKEWKTNVSKAREEYNDKLKKMEARFEAGRALALSKAVNKAVREADEQLDAAKTEVKAAGVIVDEAKKKMDEQQRRLDAQKTQLDQFNMKYQEKMQEAKREYDKKVTELNKAKEKAEKATKARAEATSKVSALNTEIKNLKRQHTKDLKDKDAAFRQERQVLVDKTKQYEKDLRGAQNQYAKDAANMKAAMAAAKTAAEKDLAAAQKKLTDALAKHVKEMEALKTKCKGELDQETGKLKRDAEAQKAKLDEELQRKQKQLDDALREKKDAMDAAEAAANAAKDSGTTADSLQRLLAQQKAQYEAQKREQDAKYKQLEQDCVLAKAALQEETARKEEALLAAHDAETAKQDEAIAKLAASLEATKDRMAKEKEAAAKEAEELLVDHINETTQRDEVIARLREEIDATTEASDRKLREAQEAAKRAAKEAADVQAATAQTVQALNDETAARRDALRVMIADLQKDLAAMQELAAAQQASLILRKEESAAALRQTNAEIDADASLSDSKKASKKAEAIAAAKEALKPLVAEANKLEKAVDEMEKEVQQKQDELDDLGGPSAMPPPPFRDSVASRVQRGDQPSALPADDPRRAQKSWLEKMMGGIADDDDDSDDDDDGGGGTSARADDAYSLCAVIRGLVGQRGPTEAATRWHDTLLPYALPDLNNFAKRAVPVRALLDSSDDPTDEEVAEALSPLSANKRQKIGTYESPAIAAEAFEALGDNFAIIGSTPAADLPEERCGIEPPHEVRWMPQGERAETMARVAVLEHAVARCKQVAANEETGEEAAAALRRAGAVLKFRQMEDLYELNEAAEFGDNPHPLGTETRLVTRPCAMVRGVLSYPTDPGVHPIAEGTKDQPLSGSADLAKAVANTAAETAALRNELRREGHPSHFYVAPPADKLEFVDLASGTGAVADVAQGVAAAVTDAAKKVFSGGASGSRANERLRPSDYAADTWQRVINRAIVAAAALTFEGDKEAEGGGPDAIKAFLEMNKSKPDGAGEVTAQTRRDGLWTEMLRHLAISQDRLWIFIRLMSGTIGGDVTEVITMADQATLKAAKAIQDQRLEISKRVSDMQAKIVETVVSSMLKKSELTMGLANDSVAVIDAEAKKKLHELASGASGRPFFEANVALKNLTEASDDPPSLQDVLNSLANVGVHMQSTLEQTLAEPGAASASLVELSHPSNSYFVSLRTDAVAAIRSAHETLNAELGIVGGRRRISLWELVEGGCQVLTNRFADLCGYMLVQARTSTGVSAMYVSHHNMYTNRSLARTALAKLVAAANAYTRSVSVPAFDAIDTQVERFRILTAGERVTDMSITARPVALARPALTAPISSSGWWNEGGKRY